MRIVCGGVVAVLVAGLTLAMAQAPVGAAPANAAAAMGRPVAGNPGQAGREALYKYLDDIAAKDEAARRAEIAKIQTREQAEVRQQEVRSRILELLGGGFERTPLNAKVMGETQMEGFRIEKVVYESQPGFYVTALLYVPDGKGRPQGLKPDATLSANGTAEAVPLSKTGDSAVADPTHAQTARMTGDSAVADPTHAQTARKTGAPADPTRAQTARMNGAPDVVTSPKLPAVVMAPGHTASGKAGDYAMAAAFARNGFVVLSYDPIGQGERLQYLDPKNATKMQAGDPYPGVSLATRSTGEHGEAGLQPTLIGDAVARYFLWDGMRAVDYLISRPEVDAEKIGAFGCSGGGAMTALLGAADKRVKAVATACYLTTMETLLPSIGAQDAEQSIPDFIASGFDFADWVELAAPRAYAMVGTTGDMFPWKGFLETATEARRFYSLFDASAGGSSQLSVVSSQLQTPTGPTLNPDTVATIPADAPFQVIAGIGGHGNLKPLTADIVGFFLVHLAGRGADTFVAGPAAVAGASPFALPDVPKGALQVTATGQVATSYPGSETVFSLNLKRAKEKLPKLPVQTMLQVQTDVREVTEAEAVPGRAVPEHQEAVEAIPVQPNSTTTESGGISTTTYGAPYLQGDPVMREVELMTVPGSELHANLYVPQTPGKHPAILMMRESVHAPAVAQRTAEIERLKAMAVAGTLALEVTPRPSPPGGEETKAAILGPFYLTELRAELVGKTLLGMRVDDVIRAVDYLASRPDVDAKNITVVASGHMGLVALNAAVLDSRIRHVTVDHVLESYASLLEAPMPVDAPQDILPGVLEKYDVPDLVRVLGDRVTATDWLPGTADLSGK